MRLSSARKEMTNRENWLNSTENLSLNKRFHFPRGRISESTSVKSIMNPIEAAITNRDKTTKRLLERINRKSNDR